MMEENKKSKLIDNTILIINEVLGEFKDREEIKKSYEDIQKLIKKRKIL